MLRTIAVALTLLITTEAIAAWGPNTTITEYFVYDNGDAYFITAGNQNYGSCGSSQYVALAQNATKFNAIWAQIMAAHAAGLTVSVNFDGCLNGYPKAIAIAVKP